MFTLVHLYGSWTTAARLGYALIYPGTLEDRISEQQNLVEGQSA